MAKPKSKSNKRGLEDDDTSSTSVEPLTKTARSGRTVFTVGKCAQGCTTSILNKKEAIACHLCGEYTHVKCAIPDITEKEIIKKFEGEKASLQRIIEATRKQNRTFELKIESQKAKDHTLFSQENLAIFNTMLQTAISPLLAEIRILRNEINEIREKQKTQPVIQSPSKLKKPPPLAMNPKSMAEILENSNRPIESVRNLSIKGTDEEVKDTIEKMKNDENITDSLISSIRDTGRGNFTIRCATVETMNELCEKIGTLYPTIEIKKIVPRTPQIKIVGIPYDLDISDEYLITEIESNNDWFVGNCKVLRTYKVESQNRYQCAILEVSIDLMKKCMTNKRLSFGFNQCRIYEQNNVIQCRNCFRLGHMARVCTFESRCRKCGGEGHEYLTCENELNCANCQDERKKGLDIPSNHFATEDKCYMKKKMTESLTQESWRS